MSTRTIPARAMRARNGVLARHPPFRPTIDTRPVNRGLAPLIIRTLTPFCPQPRSCSRSRTRRRWKRWSRRYRGSALASNTGFRRLGKEKEGRNTGVSHFYPSVGFRSRSASGSSLRSFLALGWNQMKSMDNRWIRILRNLWSGPSIESTSRDVNAFFSTTGPIVRDEISFESNKRVRWFMESKKFFISKKLLRVPYKVFNLSFLPSITMNISFYNFSIW